MANRIVLLMAFLIVGCSQQIEGTVIGYDVNGKPSNWACSSTQFTVVKADDGTVVRLCGFRGNVGDRLKWVVG